MISLIVALTLATTGLGLWLYAVFLRPAAATFLRPETDSVAEGIRGSINEPVSLEFESSSGSVTFEVVFPGVSVRRFPTLEAANEHAAGCRQLGMRCLVQVTEASNWPRR